MINVKKIVSMSILLLLLTFWSAAQDGTEQKLEIVEIELADNLYVLKDVTGFGNSGLFIHEEGALLIDSKTAEYTTVLDNKIAELTGNDVTELVLTHWHFDHTGGNQYFGLKGAKIIAAENVLTRMSTPQRIDLFDMDVPPASPEAQPSIVYKEELLLTRDDQPIKLFHPGPGHTDGDSCIYFPEADVLFLGDLYFEGMYPFIDISTGGSIDYMIERGNEIIADFDDDTVVVPGHGPVADIKTYKKFIKMLKTVRKKIARLIKQGKTLEQTIAAKPTKKYDALWGNGFLNPETFCTMVYQDLVRKK